VYSKVDIYRDISKIPINKSGTLLIHSSMKSIGEVQGRADTILDIFIELMKDGLLVFPTHTWDSYNNKDDTYNPLTEPSCVGILSNLFMKREGVVRSLHPTHSVAAIGKDSDDFIDGEEFSNTPCPRNGCWGKLYNRRAQILFIGVNLTKNTFIHGVEEWNGIPNRLTGREYRIKVVKKNNEEIFSHIKRHWNEYGDVSSNYGKLLKPFMYKNICREFKIGGAKCYLCEAKEMGDLTSEFLKKEKDLFIDSTPVPEEWYR
jgi:aminoglycoside 3-N-acetyltransferase